MPNLSLFGTLPNQVPTNADLGTMAYQDASYVRVGSLKVDGSVDLSSALALSTTANAANLLQISASPSGSGPILSWGGSDTNVDANLTSKGTGSFNFYNTVGATNYQQFKILSTTNSVNYIQVQGNVAGQAPKISVEGTDTNISLTVGAKGTGTVSLTSSLTFNISGGSAVDALVMNNNNISGVNKITFNDPGPDEGLEWLGGNGWKIYECPDDLTTNAAGNLQFVAGGVRRFTMGSNGTFYTSGNATVAGTFAVTGTSTFTGDASFVNNLNVAKNVTVTQNLTVNGTGTFTQTLSVTGTATLGQDLSVAGASTVAGDSNVGGKQRIGRDLTVSGDLKVSGLINGVNLSSTLGEVLPGTLGTVHYGSVTNSFIYDTSKDSDAGAWRKRCTTTSWYNEQLSGTWLGRFANELAARGDNLIKDPDDFNAANWSVNSVTITRFSAIASDGTPMHLCTVNASGGSRSVSSGFTPPVSGLYAVSATFLAGSSTTVAIGAYNGSTGFATSYATILSGPGTLTGGTGLQGIANLSATVPTKVAIYVTLPSTASYGLYVYPGTAANTTGNSVLMGAPKANLIGSQPWTYSGSAELLADPTFTYGIVGWTNATAGGGIVNIDSGVLHVANTVANTGPGVAAIAVPTVIGKVYNLTVSAKSKVGNGNVYFGVGNSPLSRAIAEKYTASTTYVQTTLCFIATATTTYISVVAEASLVNAEGWINLVSLKEVTTTVTPMVPYYTQLNAYYQNTGDGKFYKMNSTYGSTEVFRGNTREFPAVTAIVTESNRIVIYDATRPDTPMWMVFASKSWDKGIPAVANVAESITCITALNGTLWWGNSGTVGGTVMGALVETDFVKDGCTIEGGTAWSYVFSMNANIANRNAATVTNTATAGGGRLSHSSVNGVAVTILPDAPIDPYNGLPMHTIAVATNTGVTVLLQDGTAIQSSATTLYDSVAFVRDRLQGNYFGHLIDFGSVRTLTNSFVQAADGSLVNNGSRNVNVATRQIAHPFSYVSAGYQRTGLDVTGYGGPNGFTATKMGNTSYASMVAAINTAFNSGWQPGDTRAAWLSSTVAETITASGELITNGTFTQDISGWTLTSGAVASVSAGVVNVTTNSTSNVVLTQSFATTAGKVYQVTGTRVSGSFGLYVDASGGGSAALGGAGSVGAGNVSYTFIASGATAWISVVGAGANVSFSFDNVSVKELYGTNLVTNGAFTTDTTGWSLVRGAASVVAGAMRVTASAAYTNASVALTTVVGKQYYVKVQLVGVSAVKNVGAYAGTAVGTGDLGSVSMGSTPGIYTFKFTARGTTSYLFVQDTGSFVSGDYFDVDNIEVRDVQNYVLNGTFDVDTSSWTASSGATLSLTGNTMRVTATTGQDQSAYQRLSTTIGRTYTVTFSVTGVSAKAGMWLVQNGTATGIGNWSLGNLAVGTYNYSFVASSTTVTLFLGVWGAQGNWSEYDNVSVTDTTEILTNATFEGQTTGWTQSPNHQALITPVLSEMQVNAQTAFGCAMTPITCIVGRSYRVAALARRVSGSNTVYLEIAASNGTGIISLTTTASTSSTTPTLVYGDFVATATTHYVACRVTSLGETGGFSSITSVMVDPDRSTKYRGIPVVGNITKAPVATGAQLMAYSGFSVSNYLEHPYYSEFDYGTGDFYVMGWVNLTSTAAGVFFDRATAGGARLELYSDGTNWAYRCSVSGTGVPTSFAVTTGLHFLALIRQSGVVYYYVDGILIHSTANTENITNTSAKITLGVTYAYTSPCQGSMALWRTGACPISTDQLAKIYQDERALFQDNAQCTIAGTNNSVTSCVYDKTTNITHLTTAWGRSSFNGLQRVDSEPTPVGSTVNVSASNGVVFIGGASGGKLVYPDAYLREEIKRRDFQSRTLALVPEYYWFTGDGSKSAFTLPLGKNVKAVFRQGMLMREGSSNDYTLSYDGFRTTVTFTDIPALNYNICIMGTY